MTSGPEGSSVDSIASAFKIAEAAIKQNERLTLSLPVAAVNQLRYAAKHLVRALYFGIDSDDGRSQISKAVCHCERARFDALDGIIYSALDFIAAFQNLCRARRDVESVYPDLRKDYDEIACLQEQLQMLPRVQDMTDSDFMTMESLSNKFLSFKRKVLRLKPSVEKCKRATSDENARRAARQFLASFIISAVGTSVGILGTMCALWAMIPHSPVAGIISVLSALFVIVYATKCLYDFAVKRMLTAEQREALLGVDDFSFG